ncbi:MAG: TIGR03564 family F420-dependent LLM class oxidoreductase [Acidimicrobiales bacterium]
MRIAMSGTPLLAKGSVAAVLEHAAQAAADGFGRYHFAEAPDGGVDLLTTMAAIGLATPGLELVTAVVPTWPRHPMVMAQQALTVDQLVGGRLTLGIGLSHAPMMADLGLAFERPIKHLSEYLSVLLAVLEAGAVDFTGELYRCRAKVYNPPERRIPVLVAALGEQTLRLAGARTDGATLTWVGPRTIESHVVPTITKAAEAAGRPAPQIVASLPVCVTSEPDRMREKARSMWAYAQMPSYRAMYAREGVAGPGDLVLIGDEAQVRGELARFAAIGVTEFVAKEFTDRADDAARTHLLLREVASSSR